MNWIALASFALLMTTGCKFRSFLDSDVTQRDSSADPLKEQFGLRVNLTTNIATFFENGKPIRQWKVASARPDGRSVTPTGKFRFHELTTCVSWKSTRNSASAGPCSPNNPLGFRAMWFHTSTFGLHGVDDAHIESVTAPHAQDRRQSSGCVRNHPNDIKWLTDKVAHLYGATPADLATHVKRRVEKSYKPLGKGIALEIDRWPTDPKVSRSADTGSELSTCTTSTATGFLSGSTQLEVFDTQGQIVNRVKPFQPVCPTTSIIKDKTQVFFPTESFGFGWVDSKTLRFNCKANQKWKSLTECLSSQNPAECESLCSNNSTTDTPPMTLPVSCHTPKLDSLLVSGKSVTFVHGQSSQYKPSAVLDSTSPRKDGLRFKIGLSHSATDRSNLAFDSTDEGQTLRGFRYNISWAEGRTIEFTASWKCDRWVGTLGGEDASLFVP